MEPVVAISLCLSVIALSHTMHYKQRENIIRDILSTISQCRKLNNFKDINGEEHLETVMNYKDETELHRLSLIRLKRLDKKLDEFRKKVIDAL